MIKPKKNTVHQNNEHSSHVALHSATIAIAWYAFSMIIGASSSNRGPRNLASSRLLLSVVHLLPKVAIHSDISQPAPHEEKKKNPPGTSSATMMPGFIKPTVALLASPSLPLHNIQDVPPLSNHPYSLRPCPPLSFGSFTHTTMSNMAALHHFHLQLHSQISQRITHVCARTSEVVDAFFR